jgi:hypothetical protein
MDCAAPQLNPAGWVILARREGRPLRIRPRSIGTGLLALAAIGTVAGCASRTKARDACQAAYDDCIQGAVDDAQVRTCLESRNACRDEGE